MVGMKPPAFATWLFQLLNCSRGDTFHDLFPGSGAITRAWKFYTNNPNAQTQPRGNNPCPSTTQSIHPTGASSQHKSDSDAPTAAASAPDSAAYTNPTQNPAAATKPTTHPLYGREAQSASPSPTLHL